MTSRGLGGALGFSGVVKVTRIRAWGAAQIRRRSIWGQLLDQIVQRSLGRLCGWHERLPPPSATAHAQGTAGF